MKKLMLANFLIFAFFSCGSDSSTNKIVREGQPNVYVTEGEEMAIAYTNAVSTLHEFENAIKSEDNTLYGFNLKMKFSTSEGNEHIWIRSIYIENDKYFGIVDNEPIDIKDIHAGDSIQVDNERISDWMYMKDGILHGGYTIKAIRNRMGDEERRKFDEESEMIIVD